MISRSYRARSGYRMGESRRAAAPPGTRKSTPWWGMTGPEHQQRKGQDVMHVVGPTPVVVKVEGASGARNWQGCAAEARLR
jgi:hypothetical protein